MRQRPKTSAASWTACWRCAASSRRSKTTTCGRKREAASSDGRDHQALGRAGARVRKAPGWRDVAQHLDEIDRFCTARRRVPRAAGEPQARLKQQWQLLGRADLPEERLAQEVALLATKADVREELDRLSAHIAAARELLAEGGAVGRQARFPVPGIQPRGQHAVLQVRRRRADRASASSSRPSIDQLREQVQNIE